MADAETTAERVLFVCTANICRSPMAEGLLAARVGARGLAVEVGSAGVAARVGSGAAPGVVAALAHLGVGDVDLDAHRGRSLDAELLAGADLVLAMERAHAREAAVMAPDAWPRTFTVKELVRRGERVGPRPVGVGLRAYAERAHAGRRPDELLGASADDDVADPYGGPDEGYTSAVRELDELVARLEGLLWPEQRGRGPSTGHR